MSRQVLVITYFFPPVGGVGVVRTLKHVTYLPRWGWEPIVLAPRDPGYTLRDPSLLQAVPAGLEVHRTLSLEPARLLIHGASWLRSASHSTASVEPRRSPLSAQVSPSLARLKRGSARAWGRAWEAVLFPDQAVAWSPSAWLVGRDLVRRPGVEAIYSSGPPMSVHLIAGLLAAHAGRPWIADFRDPWIGNSFREPRSALRRRAEERLERWVVNGADRVVLSVDTLRQDFIRRYPGQASRFVHIPNGYDRAEVQGIVPQAPETGVFRLVYVGSLYRPDELQAFLDGLELLLQKRPEMRARVRVDFVGRVNQADADIALRYGSPDRLGSMIRLVGFLPRPEALARMAGASALLDLRPDDPRAAQLVGTKLYEYLALDRPILAVMPPGEGRSLVETLPGAITAEPRPEPIAAAVERLIDHPPMAARADPEGRFDRVNLAGRLAAELDAVVRGLAES